MKYMQFNLKIFLFSSPPPSFFFAASLPPLSSHPVFFFPSVFVSAVMIDECIIKRGPYCIIKRGEINAHSSEVCVCVYYCVFASWLFVKRLEAGYIHCFGSQGLPLSRSVLICFPLTQQTRSGQLIHTHTHIHIRTHMNNAHTHLLTRRSKENVPHVLTTQTLHNPTENKALPG